MFTDNFILDENLRNKVQMQHLLPDKIIATVVHDPAVNISLAVVYPQSIVSLLDKHFQLQIPNNYTTNINIKSAVDIEQIYHDTVSREILHGQEVLVNIRIVQNLIHTCEVYMDLERIYINICKFGFFAFLACSIEFYFA